MNPGLPERMEVESPTLKELDNLTKKLDLIEYKLVNFIIKVSLLI
jgi:hypothetical protein